MDDLEKSRIMFELSNPPFKKRLIAFLYENALFIKRFCSYLAKNEFYFALFVADYMAGIPTCQPYVKTKKPWNW